MHPRERFLKVAVFLLAFAFAPLVWAQAWPEKPIRLIINTAAGGPVDQVARIFAPQLGEALGQPLVIEHRAGAGGNIGLEVVAKSAPDGHTLLHTSGSPIVVGPHLYKLNFDVGRDLVPVAPTVRATQFLVVRPDLPVKSVADLIAFGRANPGKLNFGSPGNGTVLHIYGEMLLRAAKIQATHVPYKGAAPALAALLGGGLDFVFDPGGAKPHIKAGKLRLLAVVLDARSPSFPETPTMAEAGADVGADPPYGVYAPAGTPREIVTRLNREIGRIMKTAGARAALAALGPEPLTASPEAFAALMQRDRERFGAFVREANIRAD
ncbi:MAG: tripartite tricarboxylate transporter substrate binding protein [Betaproteobacteria bacterium]|nr:tripartite tricarboxylate transporter substrate binding protein [Betaproteobacteria bacterium]